MNRNLERRLQALEADSSTTWAARAEEDFWCAVSNAMGNFGPYDSELTVLERVSRFTPIEHMAWQRKFTCEADLRVLLELYDMTPPVNWAGWVLLCNWMPGD